MSLEGMGVGDDIGSSKKIGVGSLSALTSPALPSLGTCGRARERGSVEPGELFCRLLLTIF